MGAATKIVVPGVARLPAFCHAVIAGDFIYVSGMLGAEPDSMKLVEGGTGPETTQTLRNIETILEACDASLDDLVKASVYLADMATFAEMNEAWMAVIGDDPAIQRPTVEMGRDQPARVDDRQLRAIGLAHGGPIAVRQIDVGD